MWTNSYYINATAYMFHSELKRVCVCVLYTQITFCVWMFNRFATEWCIQMPGKLLLCQNNQHTLPRILFLSAHRAHIIHFQFRLNRSANNRQLLYEQFQLIHSHGHDTDTINSLYFYIYCVRIYTFIYAIQTIHTHTYSRRQRYAIHAITNSHIGEYPIHCEWLCVCVCASRSSLWAKCLSHWHIVSVSFSFIQVRYCWNSYFLDV